MSSVLLASAGATAIPAAGRTTQPHRIEVFNTLDGEARATFDDRFGCVLDTGRGLIQVLVTSRADRTTAIKLVRRLGFASVVNVRIIAPRDGEVSIQRFNAEIDRQLGGFNNRDIAFDTGPARSRRATRCIETTLIVSDQAQESVKALIEQKSPRWGDRIVVMVVPANEMPEKREAR